MYVKWQIKWNEIEALFFSECSLYLAQQNSTPWAVVKLTVFMLTVMLFYYLFFIKLNAIMLSAVAPNYNLNINELWQFFQSLGFKKLFYRHSLFRFNKLGCLS
jgi:hypothetical protein